MDLLRSLDPLPAGDVVDLGCGSGTVGPALAGLGRAVRGVDTSPAMLAEAEASGAYEALELADIASWHTAETLALIYSNAALHWLEDHARLLPRLAGMLTSGGTLAVQVPHQNNAPSHRVWVSLCEEMFPGRFDQTAGPGVLLPAEYHRLLSDLGTLSLWETEYYQNLEPSVTAHPVRLFTEATYARPILAMLAPDEQAELIARYEAVMEKAYPRAADGSVLFPFRRLFFTLVV
ncbi:methyltransferase domain-containing protein [Thalassovita taeanensis]|nr:methyltransferase domain-containing protein [Thalassovita taeanensis]